MNFGTLKARVAEYIKRDDLSTYIPEWINLAIRKIEREYDLEHMKKLTTTGLTITIGSNTIDISSLNVKKVRSLCLIDNNQKFFLEEKDLEDVITDELDTNAVNTMPTSFAREGDYLVFNHKFDKVYAYEFRYWGFSPNLVNDTDTNWLTDNAWDCIIYGACLEAEALMVNDPRLVTWKSLYSDALENLVRPYKKRPIADLDDILISPIPSRINNMW